MVTRKCWLDALKWLFPDAPARRALERYGLHLETLEDRTTPAVIDLTSQGAFGFANGALFAQHDQQPAGSGVIDSFLRIQAQGAKQTVEQGYNTDHRGLQFDEKSSATFTRSLNLADVPLDPSGQYREFLLDINQKASASLLSLDELRLFVGSRGDLTGYDTSTYQLAGLSPVYDMGANWVKLDGQLGEGSGKADMIVGIPNSAFAAAGPNSFVYLYSKFGVNDGANGGYEEWAVGHESIALPIPVQTTGSLGGMITNMPSSVVTLNLVNDQGVIVATTTAKSDGSFSFGDVPAGHYTLDVPAPTPDFDVTQVPVDVVAGQQDSIVLTLQEGQR